MSTEIIYGGVALVIVVVAYMCYRYYKSLEPVVTQDYSCSEGSFKVKGRMDNFTIKKNDHIEFLIKDGVVVAVRDKNKSDKFIYYKE